MAEEDIVMNEKESRSKDADYYHLNHDRFVGFFMWFYDRVLEYLTERRDCQAAQAICDRAKEEFEILLPSLPYMGGDERVTTKWVLIAGCFVAFYRPMKVKNHTAKEIGQMMYDLYLELLDATPEEELVRNGKLIFTEAFVDGIKAWAESTATAKAFEKEFSVSFIPPEDGNFDYGLDYHYCPFPEYFKNHGVSELAPYFCLLDFPDSQKLGTGLIRTKSLAQGDNVCDFRYKKGRPVTQNWETEWPKLEGIR